MSKFRHRVIEAFTHNRISIWKRDPFRNQLIQLMKLLLTTEQITQTSTEYGQHEKVHPFKHIPGLINVLHKWNFIDCIGPELR